MATEAPAAARTGYMDRTVSGTQNGNKRSGFSAAIPAGYTCTFTVPSADCTLRGIKVKPEVMIPLTGHINELKWIQPRLIEIARKVMEEKKVTFTYKFGTMIEIPRAAVTAEEIASVAEFFSFGTNDLTQMTFGYSRDDAERSFLVQYVETGILPKNPFQTLDQDGVGRLMRMAVDDGRKARPELEVGICGEHGGDPATIEFCHIIGQNYVSCSPFRVPIARLAAAKAAIKHASGKINTDL